MPGREKGEEGALGFRGELGKVFVEINLKQIALVRPTLLLASVHPVKPTEKGNIFQFVSTTILILPRRVGHFRPQLRKKNSFQIQTGGLTTFSIIPRIGLDEVTQVIVASILRLCK